MPKVILLSLSLALFLTSVAQGQAPNDKADHAEATAIHPKELIGVWEGYLAEGDGSKPSQRVSDVTLIVTPEKISTKAQGNAGEGTYRISAGSGNVHFIDTTGTAGHYEGKSYAGIFTLQGDTLRWCSGDAGWPRPTEMRTKYSEGRYLMVLTRKK